MKPFSKVQLRRGYCRSFHLQVLLPRNVLVLGANGGTGQACVQVLQSINRPCIAATRSGTLKYEAPGVTTAAVDVSSVSDLQRAITSDVGAVIFAASVGTKGGDAFAVDRDGVIETAKACIAAQVPRLVVVSSGTVTRPDSGVYKLLNTLGKGIMEAKIQGEDQVRDLYSNPAVLSKNLGYTIIRPGGLTTGPGVGVANLELNQGDAKSGRLDRMDVASLCVQSLYSSAAFDTTFECYEKSTAKPIEAVGLSNILKSRDATAFMTGKERQGSTWDEIFTGLERDPGHTA